MDNPRRSAQLEAIEGDGTRPRAARTNATLGPQARRVRKEFGPTLAEVSEATGISISTISNIENDQVSPTFANLMRLAEGLDIPLSCQRQRDYVPGRRSNNVPLGTDR